MLQFLLDGQPAATAPAVVEDARVELSALPPHGATLELVLAGVTLEPFLRPGAPAWCWRWTAPAASGAYPFVLRACWPTGVCEQIQGELRVVPRKLDQAHYALLLADLQRIGRALVFALSGGREGATPSVDPQPAPPSPAEELPTLFGSEFERFVAAVERLARRPPAHLRPGFAMVEPGRLRNFSALGTLRPTGPSPLTDSDDPAAFAAGLRTLPEPAPTSVYDSYETRLLQRLLATLARRAEHLARQAGLPAAQATQAELASERLRGLRSLPFLSGVPPLARYTGPSSRMQRDPDYRAVLRLWRLLRQRPLISWEAATLHLPLAELPRLYERWCVARVAFALLTLAGWQLTAQRIMAGGEGDRLLDLPEQEPLLELAGAAGSVLRLFYHPRYRSFAHLATGAPLPELGSLDRHTRIPDLALELRRPAQPPLLLVLDAKYRLEPTGGVPQAALADAYSYLGAIGGPQGHRATAAVALLYPGHGPGETYASGVAALPLLPGAEQAVEAWLGRQVASHT